MSKLGKAIGAAPLWGLALICTLALFETAWFQRVKSVTYDETLYLSSALQTRHDGRLDPRLVARGVAPLAVWLYFTPSLLNAPDQARPEIKRAQPEDARLIGAPRLANTLGCGIPLGVVVFVWLKRRRGVAAAAFGAAMLALSPTTIAHVSLATTDASVALYSTLGLATLAWYLRSPSWSRLVWVAVSFGAALSAKYSALFLVPTAALLLPLHPPPGTSDSHEGRFHGLSSGASRLLLLLCLVAPACWGFHLFAVSGPLKSASARETPDSSVWVRALGRGPTANRVMDVAHDRLVRPSPVQGIAFQVSHDSTGHPAFLMGKRSQSGWWYYFPLAFAFKSTPSELLLAAGLIGVLIAAMRRPFGTFRQLDVGMQVLVVGLLIYTAMMLTSRINIGQRYLTPIYPWLVILGTDRLWHWLASRRRVLAAVVLGLLAGQLASNVAAAPHFIAYFNEPSGGSQNGWRLLVDSNVDWGQDLPALARELDVLGKPNTALAYFGTALAESYGVRADPVEALARPLDDYSVLAISVTYLQGIHLAGGDPFQEFRDMAPVAAAGHSILVFDLEAPAAREAFRKAVEKIRQESSSPRVNSSSIRSSDGGCSTDRAANSSAWG